MTLGQSPLPLPIGRYRFAAVFEHDLALPANAGSLLRSVFGMALRHGACITGTADCKACPLYRSCAYPTLFETPPRDTQLGQRFSQVPNPYVMEPPPLDTPGVATGQLLLWEQVLIGPEALHQLPLVVRAWERALHNGWGDRRVQGRLVDVAFVGADGEAVPVREPGSGGLQPHEARLMLPLASPNAVDVVHLHFHTPLRLQHEGRPLRPAELSPRKLVADLLRRCNLMLDLHLGVSPAPFDAPALVAHATTLADDRSPLRWRDDARYSARQRQQTPLGGVLGHWTLRGDLAPLLPWLWLGQWLHLGKNATMGLGGYHLEVQA